MSLLINPVLSIDLGSTTCKVLVIDKEGKVLSESYNTYPLYSPTQDRAEEDPRDWINAVKKGIREALLRGGIPPLAIEAVVVTGQAVSVTPIDKDGRFLRPAILTFMDNRSQKIRNEIAPKYNMNFSEMMLFGISIWLRENELEIYEKMWKILDARNLIVYFLTDRETYDAIAISPKRMKLLSNAFNFSEGIFGHPHTSYFKEVGFTTKRIEEDIGIPQRTPVFLAPWDGMCNIIGSGLTREGIGMDVAGTTEILAVTTSNKIPIVTHKHLIEGLWLVYMSTPLTIAHRWFAENVLGNKRLHDMNVYHVIDSMAENADIERTPILLPTFKGEQSKPSLRGGIMGLTLDVGLRHIARSILESIAFYIKMKFDWMESKGARIKEIIVSGGGAKSKVWNRIKADILGKPVKIPHTTETAALGAAMIAFTALKEYKDLTDAVKGMLRIKEIYRPDERDKELYDKKYDVFKAFYDAISKMEL